MKFYITKDIVRLRKDAGLSSETLGFVNSDMIVYDLNESFIFNSMKWIKLLAPIQDGRWLIGYSAEAYNDNNDNRVALLEEFVPHVTGLLTPYLGRCYLTQMFAENPNTYAKLGYNGHNGLDFSQGQDSLIHAMAPGIVEQQRFDATGYGNYAKVTGATITTIYAHMDKVVIREGEYVGAGQPLGTQGNTGFSSGSHLHMDIRILNNCNPNNGYGGRIDLLPYLDWKYIQFPSYVDILNKCK